MYVNVLSLNMIALCESNSSLPVPSRPWKYVFMDFIINLLEVDGYDATVPFVDVFSKQSHSIPCAKTMKKEIYRLHG